MRRDVNFFSVYHYQADGQSDNLFKIIALLLTAASLILVLGWFSYLKFSDAEVKSKLNDGNGYLQSPQVSQAQQKLATGSAALTALNGYEQAAEKVTSEFDKIPQPDSKLLQSIASMEPKQVSVTTISYTGGTLLLSCTSTDNLSPAVFAHALQQSGDFAQVGYQGFSKSGNNSFNFTIAVVLKEGSQ